MLQELRAQPGSSVAVGAEVGVAGAGGGADVDDAGVGVDATFEVVDEAADGALVACPDVIAVFFLHRAASVFDSLEQAGASRFGGAGECQRLDA